MNTTTDGRNHHVHSEGVAWIRRLFYSMFITIYLLADISLVVFVIKWNHLPSIFLFGVLSVLFIGAAYGLARQLVALIVR